MQAKVDPIDGSITFHKIEVDTGVTSFLESARKEQENRAKKGSDSIIGDVNARFCPEPSNLSVEEKKRLVKEVGEEIIKESDLDRLFKEKVHPICYDGFEPSGRMHIAQGVLKAINVNRLVKAGCIFIFWVADWFAMLNNKMGGDLTKIQVVGQYFIEIWKALGMKLENVYFMWASEEINKKPSEYWLTVIDIARKNTVSRIKRCATIMGRKEQDDMAVAMSLYPCMQCSDVFFLKADICQLGMDQRKVNMLAREYCDDVKIKNKPVIVSHHMLMGLQEGQEKMSKSDPNSAIFMEDTEKDVTTKIKKAFCPPGVVEKNPCMDYVKSIVFGAFDSFTVERKEQNGGNKTYTSYAELEQDYLSQALHPSDLKPALTKAINHLIEPVRQHFQTDAFAKRILELVRSYQVTK